MEFNRSNYLLNLPHEIRLEIIQYIRLDDLIAISDIIYIKNLDYLTLIQKISDEYNSPKFLYGDSAIKFDWRSLYIELIGDNHPGYNRTIYKTLTQKLGSFPSGYNLRLLLVKSRINYLSTEDMLYCVKESKPSIYDTELWINISNYVTKNNVNCDAFYNDFSDSFYGRNDILIYIYMYLYRRNINWILGKGYESFQLVYNNIIKQTNHTERHYKNNKDDNNIKKVRTTLINMLKYLCKHNLR